MNTDSNRYFVQLAGGQSGYIHAIYREYFLPYDPVARRRSDAEECLRRGQPTIGMTKDETEATCWGRAARLERETTAAGIVERMFFKYGRAIEMTNGHVSKIVVRE